MADDGRRAVLYPVVAEAARRAGAEAIGLVDVFCGDGSTLLLDRVGIACEGGPFLGDRAAPVQLTCTVVRERPPPARALPPVVARVGLDRTPGEVPDGVRLDGDPVDLLADAVARVPDGALPVVTTTWALSRVTPERRLRFLQRLDDVAAHRPVAWASVEGVGVAPAIPTFGDRRASGHSILGVAVLDGAAVSAEAVGRCWSRGRMVAWLADVSGR